MSTTAFKIICFICTLGYGLFNYISLSGLSLEPFQIRAIQQIERQIFLIENFSPGLPYTYLVNNL